MRILITNDDGISSPALPRLIRYAKQFGEVTAVAPKYEQSGKSHAIDFHGEIEIKKVSLDGDLEAYSVDSSPADCVRYGVLGLHEKYDLVISGINKGFNLGKDIVYSGTAGAIFEAGRLGLRGIAISTDPSTFDHAFDRLDALLRFFRENKLLEANGLYNVNIPLDAEGFRITRQGGIYYTDEFVCRGGDIYIQVGGPAPAESDDIAYDIPALERGYISITPLTADRTDLVAFATLSRDINKLDPQQYKK